MKGAASLFLDSFLLSLSLSRCSPKALFTFSSLSLPLFSQSLHSLSRSLSLSLCVCLSPTALPSSTSSLCCLTELRVFRNEIRALPPLASLSRLTVMDLRHNSNVQSLPPSLFLFSRCIISLCLNPGAQRDRPRERERERWGKRADGWNAIQCIMRS